MMTRTQMLLQKLQEELAESIVEASKCQNFGLHETYSDPVANPQQLTNLQRLKRELQDVVAVCDMLERTGELDRALLARDENWIKLKKAKVERYLAYSQSLGIMHKTHCLTRSRWRAEPTGTSVAGSGPRTWRSTNPDGLDDAH